MNTIPKPNYCERNGINVYIPPMFFHCTGSKRALEKLAGNLRELAEVLETGGDFITWYKNKCDNQ